MKDTFLPFPQPLCAEIFTCLLPLYFHLFFSPEVTLDGSPPRFGQDLQNLLRKSELFFCHAKLSTTIMHKFYSCAILLEAMAKIKLSFFRGNLHRKVLIFRKIF
jgi:hypothetical protein